MVPRVQADTPDSEAERLEALLARARAGEAAAFQTLVRPQVGALFGLAQRLAGGRREQAEEAVQDALVRAWRGIEGLEAAGALRTWLFRIVVRCSLDERRRRRAAGARSAGVEATEVPAGLASDPSAGMEARELRDRLAEAMERLPERQRMALHLRASEGLGYEAIGAALECSTGAARMLVLEARRRVRERLGSHLEER